MMIGLARPVAVSANVYACSGLSNGVTGPKRDSIRLQYYRKTRVLTLTGVSCTSVQYTDSRHFYNLELCDADHNNN